MKTSKQGSADRKLWRKINFGLVLVIICALTLLAVNAQEIDTIEITPAFLGQELAPNERIQLNLSRSLASGEGRLAVFINETDVTALFLSEPQMLHYTPGIFTPPTGRNKLVVYLVQPDAEWKTLAEFELNVTSQAKLASSQEPAQSNPSGNTGSNEDTDGWKAEFAPNISINVKGQNQTAAFPRASASERDPFIDVAGQGSFVFKVARRSLAFTSQFDFAGSSFQREALRFGELQNRAPKIDLSSYLIELGKGRFKLNLGHISFGTNRHLVSSFSSRGIMATIPVGAQNEVILSAANGTSIVGFDNLIGVTRRKHSVASATFAREFIKERPGGLRFEISLLRGSLLPLSDFNQGEVNDAETSSGFGFRVSGTDKNQRLRYEAGFTRSRFTNPGDPELAQGFNLTAIGNKSKNARYGEISFDFLRGLKLWKDKKLRLTGTFRHEEIEPLFRSIGAFSQADRSQNQFEASGNFGELNFAFGTLRDRDNLDDILSLLKTLNRRKNFVIGVPLGRFFTPSKPKKWLPVVSYSYNYTHQFGAFLPGNGDFFDESQVPDQRSYSRSFSAQWQISDKLSVGYQFNRAFQDNQQRGRQNADFSSSVNAVSVNLRSLRDVDISIDFRKERQKNFELPRIDRTLRIGSRATWRTPFLKNSNFSGGFSTTLAGDTGNLSDSRNAELDVQWAYQFTLGREKFKKFSAQFFVRYANRYRDRIDRQFSINSINKTQTFNLGLSFSFF